MIDMSTGRMRGGAARLVDYLASGHTSKRTHAGWYAKEMMAGPYAGTRARYRSLNVFLVLTVVGRSGVVG